LRDDGISLLGARLEIDRDRQAALGQRHSDRPSNAPRSACDKRYMPLKTNQILPPARDEPSA
jgi:hypothetical protein